MANNKNYNKVRGMLEGTKLPFENSVFMTALVSMNRERISANTNEKYYEFKFLTTFNYTEFSEVFANDKNNLIFNAKVPAVLYPLTHGLQTIAEYAATVEMKELVAVRGFLTTLFVEKVDFAKTKLRKEAETFLHIASIHDCHVKFEKPDFSKIGAPINYVSLSGIVIDKQTAQGRDGRTLLAMTVALPKMHEKIMQFSDVGAPPLELIDIVYFGKEGERIDKSLNIGDYVATKGRFINKFFDRDLFKKPLKFFLVEAYAISVINLEFDSKDIDKIKEYADSEVDSEDR